jgi:hypothetical protein
MGSDFGTSYKKAVSIWVLSWSLPGVTEEKAKPVSQDSQSPGQDLNLRPAKWKIPSSEIWQFVTTAFGFRARVLL